MTRTNSLQISILRFFPASALSLSLLCAAACSSEGDAGTGDGDGDASMGDGDLGDGDVGDGDLGDGDAPATGGTTAGSGGSSAASGGEAATGGTDASGGDSAGTGGSDEGTGGAMEPQPDAVATASIVGINGSGISGTATFTQIDGMVELVVQLESCPTGEGDNPHGSHLHEVNDCGNDGSSAGGHWSSGEVIGNIQCDQASTEYTVSISTDVWTIGGDASTDITQRSIMIHQGPTGTRIGCGEISIVE